MADDDESFVPLTHKILCECLSVIDSALGQGGFAFTKLDCSGKELTDLGNKVEKYKQLRQINLSDNKFTDLTKVTQLPHLLDLKASNNEVKSLACMEEADLPWCQKLDLSSNKLTSLPNLGLLKRLRFAIFQGNEIATLRDFGGHPALEELELSSNSLTTLEGFGELPVLRRLVLSGNQLESLEGLAAPTLTMLDVSSNQLAALKGIGGAPLVQEIDLSENKLEAENPNLPEVRRLADETPELRTLKLEGNSLGGNSRIEALVCVPFLTNIDGEDVTPEDQQAAEERKEELRQLEEERLQAEEEARLQAEEEARLAAEEAAAAAAEEQEEGEGAAEDDA